MKTCPHCSVDVADDARFCPECGRRIGEETTSSAAPAPPSAGPVRTLGGLQTMDGSQTRGTSRAAGPLLAAGEVFAERYEIKSTIGAGGAGVVYAAQDRVTSEEVALKLIRPEKLEGSDAVARLVREGVTARNIRHPNVIAVYDVGEADGQPFISMEFARGQSLRSWNQRRMAARRDCSLKTAVAIVSGLLDGLEAAHARNIVHRDLKPENVILTSEPADDGAPLKILDFGIAIATGASTGVSGSGPQGSIGYMAPEQLTAPDTVGPSADLYSLSVIFYELLMDAPPQGHWQPPSGGRSGIPPGIDALIEKSLSNRSKSRPQSVAEYRKSLKAALGPTGLVDWKTLDPRKRRIGWTRPKVPVWAAWSGGTVLALGAIAVAIEEMPGESFAPDERGSEYNEVRSAGAGIATVPRDPAPSSGLSRLTGSWQDDYGSSWRMNVADSGGITGQASGGPSAGASFAGEFSGSQVRYRISAPGYGVVAEGSGQFDGGCHVSFQTFDTVGNLTLSGTLHVNHAPGAPCP